MKNRKLLALLLTLVLAIGLIPMTAFATQRDVTASSTASITINGAVASDELAAYKIVNITYNAANNTLAYAWNSDFDDYFNQTNSITNSANRAYTVEEFAALSDDPDANQTALKNLLAGLPKYIADNSIDPVATQTVAAGGTATFAGLAMGEYFIRPTSSTSVYQLMLQKVEPTVVDGTYKIDDVTFAAKHKEVNVDKTADKTSVTKGEKVKYTITVDIPTYATQAVDKSFSVADLLPDGLAIDTGSIKVQVEGVDVDAAAYDLNTTATDEYTFKLSVSTDQYADNWSADGGKQLVITYTATFNDDDTTEVNVKETNTVTFDYSYYPYVDNSRKTKTDTVDVTTFAIKIDKYEKKANPDDKSTKLAGAKFDLYRTVYPGETGEQIPHTTVNGIKLEEGLITADDGSVTFEKYEANGDKYDYYLVETQAPSGYNLLDNAVKVNFGDGDVDVNGVYTVAVSNSSGIKLPITGGTGTVIFTVIGIALMAGAVVLLVISRKKSKTKESK